MPTACLSIDLRLPAAMTLKDKRQTLRHLLDGARQRFHVAAAELDFQDLHQRALLGFAAVACDTAHVDEVLDAVERFVWSHPELEIVDSGRSWTDDD